MRAWRAHSEVPARLGAAGAEGSPDHSAGPSVAPTGRREAFPSHPDGQLAINWTPAGRELALHLRRRESKAQRILERLRSGPATSIELAQVGGLRYSARIFELRAEGHRILTEDHLDYAVYSLVEESS